MKPTCSRSLFRRLALSLIAFAASLPSVPGAWASPPVKGMALGLFSKEAKYPYDRDIQELKQAGVNSILLTVSWYQYDIRADRIEARKPNGSDEFTTPDEELVQVIRQAHEAGLSVLLFPYLRFDTRAPKEWRGVLAPKNFAAWAQSYEHFILHYARLAQATGVEFFSVGSELGSLEDKTEFWSGIIRKVRHIYRGKLLYSANWDHYQHPTFWGELDYIAITAYHRLTRNEDASFEEIAQKWLEIRRHIEAYLKKQGKKLLITEVGYPSVDGAAVAPWNYLAKTPIDLAEQEHCYRAFIQAWTGVPELEGVYWWVWYGPGGATDNSYTPRGKPALNALKNWYLPPPHP